MVVVDVARNLPPNGSGYLVVWNISESSMELVVLSARLVLLDPAYNGLQIVFSAVVIGSYTWWAWPSVKALVVEPSLLINRVMRVNVNTIGYRKHCHFLFNPLASGWLNHPSGVLTDSLSLLHLHCHCPQCEHGGGGSGGDGCVRWGYNLTKDHPGIQVFQGERVGKMGGALLWLSMELLPLDWNVTLTYLAEVQKPNQISLIITVNTSLRFLSIEQNSYVRVEILKPCNLL